MHVKLIQFLRFLLFYFFRIFFMHCNLLSRFIFEYNYWMFLYYKHQLLWYEYLPTYLYSKDFNRCNGHEMGCTTALSGMRRYFYRFYCLTPPTSLCSDNTQNLHRSSVERTPRQCPHSRWKVSVLATNQTLWSQPIGREVFLHTVLKCIVYFWLNISSDWNIQMC